MRRRDVRVLDHLAPFVDLGPRHARRVAGCARRLVSSPIHPSLSAGMADVLLVFARWTIDSVRPGEPTDQGPPELLDRLHGVHRGTVPILGAVALPEFPSLLGGDRLLKPPTILQRLEEVMGRPDELPAYNAIDAALKRFADRPTVRSRVSGTLPPASSRERQALKTTPRASG